MQSNKGEIRKSKRLCEIELANSIKDSQYFFKYFRNNKIPKSSIDLSHEEGDFITTDIEIADKKKTNKQTLNSKKSFEIKTHRDWKFPSQISVQKGQ